jgi:PAS domain S-box-containing protein
MMSKPIVLCVDDEPMILDTLEIQLRKSLGKEYLIETALSGEEALELCTDLLANQCEVPLIIADYIMPDMQGDELLKRIHKISPKTIKIMLTGQASLDAVGNAINYANLYRYITKPWQTEDLRLTVKEAVRSYFQEKKLIEQHAKLAEYNQNLEQLIKSRTQELLASEKQYRDLVETSQDMIWSVDRQGYYTFVNRAVKHIFGYEPEEMVARPFTDFEPPEQRPKDLEVFQRLLDGKSIFQHESTQLAKDGKPIHLLFNGISQRDDKGNVIGTIGTASDITQRKQTEEALRKSELMLRHIINTMPGAVYQFVLTPQGEKKYHFVSQGAYELSGYTPEQLMEDFALQWNQILPEDRERLEESIAASARERKPWFEEFRIHHTNGQIRWIQGHSLLGDSLPDGSWVWIGTLIDITDRKQREEALRLIVEGTASKTGDEFFRSCVRYLAQLLHARYAVITEWADATKTRLRSLAFWTGEDFGENYDYELANTPCQKVLEGMTCYYPENVQERFPRDRELTTLGAQSFLGIPLTNASGKILGHLAVLDTKPMANPLGSKDIPPEHHYILKIFAARAGAELERKLVEDALKQSAYAADAANRAKSEFLSRMSHELRTPLNAILGFTQLMNRNPSLSSEQQEHLGIISRSGEHLLDLINDILEMSKIESGKVTLNETSFDLYGLLDTLQEMFQLKAKFKNLELIFDRALNVPQYVKTDESKLRQVLINLLSNAIKFTESGKVILTVQRQNSDVGASLSGKEFLSTAPSNVKSEVETTNNKQQTTITFAIEDSGSGIAPEEMHLLFAPFEQTQTGRNSQQGTGLGLPISRLFVQLMGGDITVSSTVGKGTIFKFNLPLRLAQVHDVQMPQDSRRVIGLAPDQPKYRILVVDDNQLSRLLLVKLLTATGFEVCEATNGLEAIALWESGKPHLILMDMQMPVMDGYEATRKIKAREQGRWGDRESNSIISASPYPSVPTYSSSIPAQSQTIIIALTAHAFEEDRTVILSAGCDDFAIKPFREQTIFEKIARYLGVRYIYEEALVSNSSEIRLRNQENQNDNRLELYLSQMPAEWVTQLYHEAVTGSDCQLFALVEQIPSTHAPLHHALMDWVNNFRFDRVIDLIQQAKNCNEGGC